MVDALAGCAKWSLDLLCWLTDCLFNLLDDPGFLAILNSQQQFAELTRYLQSKNSVALHLLLCSSTRGFLQAVCRRLINLDSMSQRAVIFYEQRAAQANTPDALRTPPALYHAYQKMQRFTSSSLVKVADIEKLINALGQEVRQAYQSSLPGLSARQATPAQPGGGAQQNPAAPDPAVKRAQIHCELSMLLATAPPPSFQAVLLNFFNKYVRPYRARTDPSALFFADYSLLEVEDDPASLARRRASRKYVDAFTRWTLHARDGPGGDAGAIESVTPAENSDGRWRRCVRCAAVMENVYGHRPGYTFVLSQQRKCACGASWGLLPKGMMLN